MEYRVRIQFASAVVVCAIVVIALGVAASVVTSTYIAADAYTGRSEFDHRQTQSITVKGSTRRRVRSDRAVWSIVVRGEGESLVAAFEVLDSGVERVREFLTKNGFPSNQVGLGAISTTTRFARDEKGNRTDEVTGYALQRKFGVTTADVNLVAKAAGRVTQLIKEGVFVISQSPKYTYTKLAPLKIDLMAAASSDARSRAEKIALSTQCNLGELREARMGVLQITAPHSTEVSSYGMYDTYTIEKDVRAVVTATFGIEAQ
ncbi:MAG: SIMPL domain-containing protein [Planctomycetes bacterium]|nr:SIMPL domain-containing protein [Planctomycetota bacterium]